MKLRTLWLSGLRLGSGTSRAHDLLGLLARCRADTLFLVGDTVDRHRGQERPFRPARFPACDGEAWLKLIDLARQGVRVVYLPGLADADAIRHDGQSIGGIHYQRVAEHATVDGRRLLVTSACEFDSALRDGTAIEPYAAGALAWLTRADARFSALRDALGSEFSPAATGVRRRLVRARDYMTRLETSLRAHARACGFDGAVCGRLHSPVAEEADGFLFASAGDWSEQHCVLAEYPDGRLQLLPHDVACDRAYACRSIDEPIGQPIGSLAA